MKKLIITATEEDNKTITLKFDFEPMIDLEKPTHEDNALAQIFVALQKIIKDNEDKKDNASVA